MRGPVTACMASLRFRGAAPLIVVRSMSPRFASTAEPKKPAAIDFSDTKKAYESKSMLQLVRSWLVFNLSSWKWLVANSDKLVKTTSKIFGKGLLSLVLKPTFFGHFCAGEDEKTIRPTVKYLRANGIGSILDYAAEADVEEEAKNPNLTVPASPLAPSNEELAKAGTSQPARTFEYEGENKCEENMEIFKSCILAVHNVTPEGFAAIKVTALGVPALLERLSTAIISAQQVFTSLDTNHDGYVGYPEFLVWYQTMYGSNDEARAKAFFDKARKSVSGPQGKFADEEKGLDYVSWSSMWTLRDIWHLLKRSSAQGPLADSALNDEELRLVENMYKRVHIVGEYASSLGVRLMIDAEQTYFQPAIDHATLELQHAYNKTFPTIFGTYQCYLKHTPSRVLMDLDRANRYGYLFAAKIVRGAYIKIENDRAIARGEPSPICDTLQDTHDNYHRVMQYIISRPNRNLVIATHNQKSIETAVDYMAVHNIDPATGGVYFAQLLGMADHLTFSLGRNGYKAYKYVPYGPVHEVIPYLIRRAQENGDLIAGGGGANEIRMSKVEIKRRLFKL